MSNKFCRLLSNGYKINIHNNELLWSPCCFYEKKTPLLDKEQFQKELKYTSSATDWLPECRQCQQMELSGEEMLSPRSISYKKVPEDVADGDCVALEISFDTKCNAACLSCGSYCSTTWEKYNRKHKLYNYSPRKSSGDELLQKLIDNVDLTKLRDIFMMGGEPLYSDTQLKLLKYLEANHPALDQVILRYQTNGSIIPSDEVKQLWSKFKRVMISLSIDGVGERFNYLRWPLKWHRVERTVQDLIPISNIIFNVNATLSPLNILYFNEIEEWIIKNIPKEKLREPDKPVRPNRCMGVMDLQMVTDELKADVINKYGPDHRVSKMFTGLYLRHEIPAMMEYIEQHDQLRKLNWQETFPDTVKYYKK